MGFDDFAAQRQPEAGAPLPLLVGLLGGVERLEDFPQLVGRNAAAGVADGDLGHGGLLVRPDGQVQRAAVVHRLPCVDDQVEHAPAGSGWR